MKFVKACVYLGICACMFASSSLPHIAPTCCNKKFDQEDDWEAFLKVLKEKPGQDHPDFAKRLLEGLLYDQIEGGIMPEPIRAEICNQLAKAVQDNNTEAEDESLYKAKRSGQSSMASAQKNIDESTLGLKVRVTNRKHSMYGRMGNLLQNKGTRSRIDFGKHGFAIMKKVDFEIVGLE